MAEQLTDVRDKLIFMSKITSKLLGKHTKSCQMLKKGLSSTYKNDIELLMIMVQSIRWSLKKGGAGVEYAYQQAKALLDLVSTRNDQNFVPTDVIVKAHKQASKLLFLLSQCEQTIPEASKQ